MQKITFQYLNSLKWVNYEENCNLIFEAENDDYTFFLLKDKKNKIFLEINDKETYTTIIYCHIKLINLYKNLLLEIKSIQEKMYKMIDLDLS